MANIDPRSRRFELRDINDIDGDRLWVTVFDENGMECDVEIIGLTADRMRSFLADNPVHVKP